MNNARKPPRFPLAGESEAHPFETVLLWVLGRAVFESVRSSQAGARKLQLLRSSWSFKRGVR